MAKKLPKYIASVKKAAKAEGESPAKEAAEQKMGGGKKKKGYGSSGPDVMS